MFSLTGGQITGSFELSYRPPFVFPSLPALFGNTIPQGQVAWNGVSGIYNGGTNTTYWNVPAKVSNISIVAIGAGGGGGSPAGPWAAGGGGLAYGSIQVVPGSNITIVYGNGGGNYLSGGTFNHGPGGASSVSYLGSTIVIGYGGGDISSSSGTSAGGSYSTTGVDSSQPYGGGSGGAGYGGITGNGTGGGGGAGGYSGTGGAGGANATGSAGSGGGGGGGYQSSGGGVGYLGAGSSGGAQSSAGSGGNGGSGGGQGGLSPSYVGGSFGGGGGGSYMYLNPYSSYPQYGGPGAVRIVWGQNRRYPDTANVADVTAITWPNSPRDLANIVAWYDEQSFDDRRQVWYDRLGNTSISATTVNCSLVSLSGGNGANTNLVSAISGSTSSSITWPTGLVSNTYTIFHVTRYSGSNKQRIYSTTGGQDWASGHINGAAGQFKHGSLLTGSDGVTDYYGTNWFLTTDQLNLGRTNGVTRGTGSGITTYPATLAINKYSTEKSDFQTVCLIICSGETVLGDYLALETWLRNYYGITS